MDSLLLTNYQVNGDINTFFSFEAVQQNIIHFFPSYIY